MTRNQCPVTQQMPLKFGHCCLQKRTCEMGVLRHNIPTGTPLHQLAEQHFCLSVCSLVLGSYTISSRKPFSVQSWLSRNSLGRPGWLASVQHREPPASVSQVLSLKVCTTVPGWLANFSGKATLESGVLLSEYWLHLC